MEVKFVKVHDDAVLPAQNNKESVIIDGVLAPTSDSGYDITAVGDMLIPAKGAAVVPVGFKVGYITPGYWFKIEARSGLSFKHGILPHPGIVDCMYRGALGVRLYNHSTDDYHVSKGDKIAQFVVYPIIEAETGWIDEAVETTRGEKGFGSSDKK